MQATPVIPAPTGSAEDFHLLAQIAETLLYVPRSETPALSTDLIRVDRLPPSQETNLIAIFQRWLAGYQQFAEGTEVKVLVAVNEPNEFLTYAGFADHPFIGGHQTIWRYLRGIGSDYGVQFIRKLDPLSDAQVLERIEYVRNFQLPRGIFTSAAPDYSEFALTAHRQSEQIRELTEEIARTKSTALMEVPLPELGAILTGASPFHNPKLWANLVRFYGRNVLYAGVIDQFDIAVKCLRFALIALNDARQDEFLRSLLYDTAENLAELLMYTYGESRAANLARAVYLYRTLAEVWSDSEPDKALNAEIMAGFCAVLNDPDSAKPLDSWFSDRARIALLEKEHVEKAIDFLLECNNNLAYVARRKDRGIFNDACLAGDLSQLVMERAYAKGIFDFEDSTGKVAVAFQAQLDSQLGLHGITQQDLDRTAAGFKQRYRKTPPNLMPKLVLLRPLSTSRRIQMPNRFGLYYADLLVDYMPETISLEAALHLAFMRRFTTEALGGPIDIFGMARSTAMGMSSESGKPTWQGCASLLIEYASVVVALFDDRDAMLWELGEVARQNAFEKLILIALPNTSSTVQGYTDAATQKLRNLGFDLPRGIRESGFFLFNDVGAIADTLPFDCLWSGKLFEAVLARSLKRKWARGRRDGL